MNKKSLLLLLFIHFYLFISHAVAQDETIVFTPQWTAQAQFAGYYVAEAKGFYREAGLDVDIVHPSVSLKAIDRIQRNMANATTFQLAEAIELVAQGIPLVNILQTSMNNAMVIVSARDKDPLTQKGARVGIWSVGFGQLAICMSIKDHLDYEWVRFTSHINLFLSGAIDATMAVSYNEYYQLMQAGFKMSEDNIYRFSEHGFNIQENGVYVKRDYFLTHREACQKFATATRKGWEWVAAHPDEALEIVMKYVRKYNAPTNRVMQKLMLKECLRLQLDPDSKRREFRVRPDMVEKASRLMLECGMLKRRVTYKELMGQ
jgi:NitT/TauT family transport system substrate-binding protein